MAVSDHNLIWVDMEMTGLIPEAHRVIEIATIVTDSNLTVLAEGPVLAIHQPSEALDAMDEWNTRTHTGSGLVDRVRASTVSESAAAELTLEFLRQWVPRENRRCAAIPFVRTDASWHAICRSSRHFSTIGIWMSARSRY
jgi:oligoribonuclease